MKIKKFYKLDKKIKSYIKFSLYLTNGQNKLECLPQAGVGKNLQRLNNPAHFASW
jgi:hypothetical protein